jgi:hypothetical protein
MHVHTFWDATIFCVMSLGHTQLWQLLLIMLARSNKVVEFIVELENLAVMHKQFALFYYTLSAACWLDCDCRSYTLLLVNLLKRIRP